MLELAHVSITWSYINIHEDYFYRQACVSHALNFFFISLFSLCYKTQALDCAYIHALATDTNKTTKLANLLLHILLS
jgi:hypothetical protein